MSEETNRTEPPAPDRVSLLWRRLREHRIAQWAVGYIALAYAIQHGVVLTTESMDWPHGIERVSMILLALGLPVALALAWYHGGAVSRRVSGGELSILSVLLVIGAGLFYVFARPAEEAATAPKPAVQQASVAPGGVNQGGISIAVLPFANLSGDTSQEFFSDGMTEEITAALAKVPSLRVVARTSAFEFKGQNRDVAMIAQALHATHLIEGSVRKDGNQVRITAQLIKADDGTHLWTESYDRELKGVFAVQEEIAQAITTSLRVPLGLKQGESLVSNRTADTDSYQDYLRARGLLRARGQSSSEAIAVLERVVARDPNFAPAWALLAYAYGLAPGNLGIAINGSIDQARETFETYMGKAEAGARRAIQLDPSHANGYLALGYPRFLRGKWAEAEDLFKQALALDPSDPEAFHEYSVLLCYVGYIGRCLSEREKLLAQEPFVPIFRANTGIYLLYARRVADAIRVLEPIRGNVAGNGAFPLAHAYATQGRYMEAADAVNAYQGMIYSRNDLENAARLLRSVPSFSSGSRSLPDVPGGLEFVYVLVGAPERVMEYAERRLQTGTSSGSNLWYPEYAPVRKTERYKKYMRAAGYVDYWKARGWPDLCHPVGADDFACD